jgi:alpha-L-fucosidase 2
MIKKRIAKIRSMSILLLIALYVSSACYAVDNKSQSDMLLWYNVKPSTVRGATAPQPLPVGNGLIGALVYGSVSEDRIALNETSFWSGAPHDYNDPNAGNYYKPIQDLLVAGKFIEAEKMTDEHFYGKPLGQAAYQPLGNMNFIHYGIDDDKTTNYYRDLDMLNGITSVSFTDNGVNYKREVFVSYPDRVLVMQLTADKPGKISFDVSLDSYYR